MSTLCFNRDQNRVSASFVTSTRTEHPIAVVFPGQGSQKVGMARDFHSQFAASRDAFAEASDALGLDVAALCFEEDPRLDRTEFTQPAIVTAEIAMLRALQADFGLSASYYGGHSLGEYTGLCAAGVLTLATTVKLVRRRGALMQEAVPAGEGAMVALICEGIADRDLAAEVGAFGVDVGNLNAANQVVISGPHAAVEKATESMRDVLAGTPHDAVKLNVSAPFHSRMMRRIEPEFRAALEAERDGTRADLAAGVTSNLTGTFHRPEIGAVIDALTGQISGTVNWIANMHALAAVADRIFEVGPNRPLQRFFRSAGREVTSIMSVKTAEKGLAK